MHTASHLSEFGSLLGTNVSVKTRGWRGAYGDRNTEWTSEQSEDQASVISWRECIFPLKDMFSGRLV